MKLVIGLGNPEGEYSFTRHNVGKDFLNFYVHNLNITAESSSEANFKLEPKFKSSILKIRDNIFAKPECYMNESGESVSKIISFYKINLNDVCIVYDELDLIVGNSKLTFGTGSKIHNGIDSIASTLNSKEFWHLRIGVREEKIPMSVQKFGYDPKTYVLSKFNLDDKKIVENHFKTEVNKLLDSFLEK